MPEFQYVDLGKSQVGKVDLGTRPSLTLNFELINQLGHRLILELKMMAECWGRAGTEVHLPDLRFADIELQKLAHTFLYL